MSSRDPKENWAEDCREYLRFITGREELKLASLSKMTYSDLNVLAYYLREIKDKKGRL